MRAVALALMLTACDSKAPEPTTRGIGSPDHVRSVLQTACALHQIDVRYENDRTASPSQQSTYRGRCHLVGIDKVVLGVVPYEFRYAPGTGQPVCSIRIGPSSVRGYPDLSLLSKLAEDPALSDELARLVAPLRPNTPFRMMRTVRGVLVRLELFQSTVDGPHMELLLDGCDRFTAPKDWETWDDTIKPTTPLEFSN